MAMRTPGNEFWQRQSVDIVYKLLHDQIIRDAKVCGGKSQFRKGKIKTVHAKRDLVAQFTEIRLLQTGTIADDEGTPAFMDIFKFSEALDALTSPGMKICTGKFGNAPKRVVCITSKEPNRLRDDLFKGLSHNEVGMYLL